MTEGGGGKNCQNIDYVICERPLIRGLKDELLFYFGAGYNLYLRKKHIQFDMYEICIKLP